MPDHRQTRHSDSLCSPAASSQLSQQINTTGSHLQQQHAVIGNWQLTLSPDWGRKGCCETISRNKSPFALERSGPKMVRITLLWRGEQIKRYNCWMFHVLEGLEQIRLIHGSYCWRCPAILNTLGKGRVHHLPPLLQKLAVHRVLFRFRLMGNWMKIKLWQKRPHEWLQPSEHSKMWAIP